MTHFAFPSWHIQSFWWLFCCHDRKQSHI